jgi:hypothetical protein
MAVTSREVITLFSIYKAAFHLMSNVKTCMIPFVNELVHIVNLSGTDDNKILSF